VDQAPTSTQRRVCVFCGSRSGSRPEYAEMTRAVANAIVASGLGIVYGGGSVGLMGVLADAALAAGGEVIGVIPEALSRSEIAHAGLTRLFVVGGMHERKALMAQWSDGFIALPGGFGTMDELCEVLSWRQLEIHDKPVGILNYGGYFDDLSALFDAMVAKGFLESANRRLVIESETIDELLAKMFGATPI
jgi:uncharacterized protein (TIGR00730 family)